MQKNLSLSNQLIAKLPAQERGIFLACSELIELKLHAMLSVVGEAVEHAWFPVEGFVSAILPVPGAPDMAVFQVGSEGMFPISAVFDVDHSAFNYRVQAVGRAFRMSRESLRQHLQMGGCLGGVLSRYGNARLSQLAQQTVCINHHSVEQRLARALLMSRDQLSSSELFLTHEIFSLMLGVRRESVTQAASAFQRRGLISYSRGYVMLLDERALNKMACMCYEADLQTYERAFSEARSIGVMPSGLPFFQSEQTRPLRSPAGG